MPSMMSEEEEEELMKLTILQTVWSYCLLSFVALAALALHADCSKPSRSAFVFFSRSPQVSISVVVSERW